MPETNTEEDILSTLGDSFDVADGTETTDTEDDSQDTEQKADTTQQTSTSETTDKGTTTKQTDEQSRGPQDLKDRTTGETIAAAGRERRYYENWQKSARSAQELTTKLEALQGQVDAYEKSGGLGQQYSLSPDELNTGAQIMQAWKADPANTVKYLLTQAQAMGLNVEGIGSTDHNAIKTMIDQALAPIMQERQQNADTQRQEQEATRVYESFMSTYPDAQPHQSSLARLLANDNSLSLEAAYFKLRSFYLEKGLDWSKSLEDLEKAMSQAPQKTTQQPLPHGRSHDESSVNDTAEIASADTSFDDIIRNAMGEAGIKFN
jgi:hypothetical protein